MNTFEGKFVALLIAATLGVVVIGFSAHADEAAGLGVGSQVVQYADLNLNTAVGAKVLYKRIQNAAEQVCGDVGSRQLDQATAAKACVDRAIIASVRAVNRIQLTRLAKAEGHTIEATFNVAVAP
jgi:UrcA family protein